MRGNQPRWVVQPGQVDDLSLPKLAMHSFMFCPTSLVLKTLQWGQHYIKRIRRDRAYHKMFGHICGPR
jgi:hypothetical protein